MAYVYRHIRLDKNEPFYIGIGGETDGKYKRAYQSRSRNNIWKNIVNKTEYKVEILFDDLTWEEACQKEIELIALYGRKDLNKGTLSNLTDGGDGTLGIIQSEETKRKKSEFMKGEKNPFFGKTHDENALKKMSEGQKRLYENGYVNANKGVQMSNEQKELLSILAKERSKKDGYANPMQGRNHTEESKKKMSENKKGDKSVWFGKKHSDVTKLKMSKNHAKNKMIIDLQTGFIYSSVKEAWECNKDYIGVGYSMFKSKLNGSSANNTKFQHI